jgi:hypothetical protein
VAVINAEGPVADHVVFKRIARAWGLSKTGRRMHELLSGLVAPQIGSTGIDPKCYWPQATNPASWQGFRIPGDAVESKRPLDEVPLEEIRNIARFLLEQHGSMSVESLARSISRLLGIARTTVDAVSRVGRALQIAQGPATLEIRDGIVHLRT